MQRPTLEDVARDAGVSRATVSRVVRADPAVSSQTLERVHSSIAKLGYVPNSAARTLASGKATALAVVVPEPDEFVFSDPFFGRVMAGVSSALEGARLQMVMAFAPPKGTPTATIDFLLAGGIAGVIVLSHHAADGLADAVVDLPLPKVFIGKPLLQRHRETPPRFHLVDTDNLLGGRLAGARMAATGVSHPAMITGPMDMAASIDRLRGWREELEAAALTPRIAEGDFTIASGDRAATRLLEEYPETDGIFGASDQMAIGALTALRRMGLRVGEDVKVVGFDNFADDHVFQLTTVTNPAEELGRAATRTIARLIGGEESEESVVFRPELLVRATG